MEQILRRVVVGGLYVIPFLVLYVSGSLFFPYITGKNFAFRVITEIVFFAWLVLAFLKTEYRPKWNLLMITLTVFVLVVFIADISGVYAFKSIWSNFERMEGFVTIAHLYAYFLVLTSVFKEKEWKKYFTLWLVSAFLVACYGVLQIIGLKPIHQGGVRLDATFGNATYLAVFMLMTSFFALYKAKRTEEVFKRRIYLSLFVFELFILYYTATRGAILGLIGGAILLAGLISIFERENKGLRKAARSGIALIFASLVVFFFIKDTAFVRNSQVLSRFASISLEDTTTKSRFMVWNMAIQGFKERPLLGWGQENFNYVFNKYYDPGMYGQEQWFDRTHNVFFDWLVAAGLLGFFSYLSIFCLALYLLWRSESLDYIDKSIFTGLLSAYAINNLFVFDSLGGYLLFFSVLAFISHNSVSKEICTHEVKNPNARNIAAALILIVAAFTIYKVNVPGYSQGKSLIEALTQSSTGTTEMRIERFRNALAYDSFGTAEVREYLSESANQLRGSNVSMQEKQEFYAFAFSELNNQIKRTPQDARHYVFAASLAYNYGDSETAVEYFEKALELSPKKQSILFGLGSAYLSDKKTEEALAAFKKAYDFAPQYLEARAIYAAGLIYDDKDTEALNLLTDDDGKVIYDRKVAEAFVSKNKEQKALSYLLKAVDDNKKNFDAYLSLASLYLDLNRDKEAVEVLKQGAVENPEHTKEANGYIEQIN